MIVGPKGVKQGEIELKNRATGERLTLSPEAAMNRLRDSVAEIAKEAA
jgi:prolyl-tRNA synthetase